MPSGMKERPKRKIPGHKKRLMEDYKKRMQAKPKAARPQATKPRPKKPAKQPGNPYRKFEFANGPLVVIKRKK